MSCWHRHGTHSLLGIAAFTGAAYAAWHYLDTPAGKVGLLLVLGCWAAGSHPPWVVTGGPPSGSLSASAAAADPPGGGTGWAGGNP